MPEPPRPRRILLYGATGSGKSTAAARIAERLGTPLILADDIGWLPEWQGRPLDEQRALIAEAVAGDAWVLDSAYSSWADLVAPRTELIVCLDYSRGCSLARLVRRTVRRAVTGELICNGNRETLWRAFGPDSIIVWHFRTWKRKRARMRAWAADPAGTPTLLFQRPAELEAWIEALRPASAPAAPHPID